MSVIVLTDLTFTGNVYLLHLSHRPTTNFTFCLIAALLYSTDAPMATARSIYLLNYSQKGPSQISAGCFNTAENSNKHSVGVITLG